MKRMKRWLALVLAFALTLSGISIPTVEVEAATLPNTSISKYDRMAYQHTWPIGTNYTDICSSLTSYFPAKEGFDISITPSVEEAVVEGINVITANAVYTKADTEPVTDSAEIAIIGVSEDATSVQSGTLAGNNESSLDWNITSDGVLILTGHDFDYDGITSGSYPWYSYQSSILYATFEGSFSENVNLCNFFSSHSALKGIVGIPYEVTSLDYTFRDCSNLVFTPDLTKCSNLKSMVRTFYGAKKLVVGPDLTGCPNITTFYYAFADCSSLTTEANLNDCVNATNLSSVYSGCSILKKVSFANCSKVTTLQSAFSSNKALTQVTVPSSMPDLTNASNAFRSCSALTTPISFANCTKLTNLSDAYYGCSKLTKTADVSGCSGLTTMESTYSGCSSLVTTTPFTGCTALEDMSSCFSACSKLVNVIDFTPLTGLKTISNIFVNCSILTGEPDLSKCSVLENAERAFCVTKITKYPKLGTNSNLTNIDSMASSCSLITDLPDLTGCPNLTNINSLCDGWKQVVDASSIDFSKNSKVTSAARLFSGCSKLKKAPSLLSLTGVTNFKETFSFCDVFNEVVAFPKSTTTLENTFSGCDKFNQVIDLSENTNLTSMLCSFSGCDSLKTPAITTGCTKLSSMYCTYQMSGLTKAPDFTGLSSLKNIGYVCENCDLIEDCPNLRDCSNLISISNAFRGCHNMTGTMQITTNKLTSYGSAFQYVGRDTQDGVTIDYLNDTIPIDTYIGTIFSGTKVTKGVNMSTFAKIDTVPTLPTMKKGQVVSNDTILGGKVVDYDGEELAGTWEVSPEITLSASPQAVTYTFTPEDGIHQEATKEVEYTAQKTQVSISKLPTASNIVYGEALSESTLSGDEVDVEGSWNWEDGSQELEAGDHDITAVFTPNDDAYYVTSSAIRVHVGQATPTIQTKPTTEKSTFGNTLENVELQGGMGSVEGSFTWKEPTTALVTGTHEYPVIFTPTSKNYKAIESTVSVETSQAHVSITTPPTASTITYGTMLKKSTLSNGVASVEGTFTWKNPEKICTANTTKEWVVFTPTNHTDYATAECEVNIVIEKKQSMIQTEPKASSIVYGDALSHSVLSDGVADVHGSFTWVDDTIQLTAGNKEATYQFIPTDTTNYKGFQNTVSVAVSKASPTIITNPTPSAIVYGDTLEDSVLSGGTASVDGTFTWTDSSIAPMVGVSSQSITFTPNDTNNYQNVTFSVSLETKKAIPVKKVAPTASSIIYGEDLSSSTISGGAMSVSGSFVWVDNTVKPTCVGNTNVELRFIPENSECYESVTFSIPLQVTQKEITEDEFSLICNSFVYTGKKITPAVLSHLTKNTDYTMVYQKNEIVGEASVEISGIRNYKGKVTLTFMITEADMSSDIHIQDFHGTYDEEKHFLSVTIPSGAAIDYHGADTSYTEAGSYPIDWKVSKDNYKTVTGSSIVVIDKGVFTVSCQNYTGVVDDEEHSIEVNIPSGSAITYGVTDSAITAITPPAFTEVGVYRVYYKVTKPNYYDVVDYGVVMIIEKPIVPTPVPTPVPTVEPTAAPTIEPTIVPTVKPTVAPTVAPTIQPTVKPTVAPTVKPTIVPTISPTIVPTKEPVQPTIAPTAMPTVAPTTEPTMPPVEPTLVPAPVIVPPLIVAPQPIVPLLTNVIATKKVVPKKVTISKKKVTIKVAKVKGANGYEILFAKDKKFKKGKIKVTSKSITINTKKLKKKTKYYYKIRAYQVINGKKVFSKYSKMKTLRTK